MSIMKVHISSIEIPNVKPLLSSRLREVMLERLQLDEESGQVLLYETAPQYRAMHSNQSGSFVFIEILTKPGKTKEKMKYLIDGLLEETSRILRIDAKDICICIIEVAEENWYSGTSNV